MRKITLAILGMGILYGTTALAGQPVRPGPVDQDTMLQKQLQLQAQRQAQIAEAKAKAKANADVRNSVNSRVDNETSTDTTDTTTNDNSTDYNGLTAFAYVDGSLPASPVVSSGFSDIPQETESYKVGPLFAYSFTGASAPCARSNDWAAASILAFQYRVAQAAFGAGTEAYFKLMNAGIQRAVDKCYE